MATRDPEKNTVFWLYCAHKSKTKLLTPIFVSCCRNTIPWQRHEFSEEFLNVQGNIWAFLEYLCGQKKVLDHVVFEAPNLSWFYVL